MKNLLFLSALFLFLYLPAYSQSIIDLKIMSQSTDSIELTDGTKISYTEFKKICQEAWDNSFGKMSENDKKLFEDTNIDIVVPQTPKSEKLEGIKPDLILI
jgi:hypothetical protein